MLQARSRAAGLALSLLFGLSISGAVEAVETRPVTPQERYVLSLLLASCEQGVGVWTDALVPESLWREETSSAASEVELRLGPACTGEWSLGTPLEGDPNTVTLRVGWESGLDAHIRVRVSPGGAGTFLVAEIQDLLDLPRPGGTVALSSPTGDEEQAVAGLTRGSSLGVTSLLLLITTGLIGLSLIRSEVRLFLPIVAFGVVCFSCTAEGDGSEGTAKTAASVPAYGEELDQLVGIRRKMTQAVPKPVNEIFGLLPLYSEVLERRRWSWRMQWSLAQEGRSYAATLGDKSFEMSPHGLLLNARAMAILNRAGDAAVSYETLLDRVPWSESIGLEAALNLGNLREFRRAKKLLRGLVERGARNAEVYYELSRHLVHDAELDVATEYLEGAWELRPVPRLDLLEDPLLRALVRPGRPLYRLLDVSRFEEQGFVTGAKSQVAPLDFGAGAELFVEGRELMVSTGLEPGRLSLHIPSGQELIDDQVDYRAAGSWNRAQLETVIERIPALIDGEQIATLSPHRQSVEVPLVVERLASAGRWKDLVAATSRIESWPSGIDPAVGVQRIKALIELKREDEAESFMAKLFRDMLERDGFQPRAMVELARITSKEYGRHELAVKMLRHVEAMIGDDIAEGLIRQIRLEESLEGRFEDLESETFRLRFPPGRDELAEKVQEVLIQEAARLRRWIPGAIETPIEVELLKLEDFIAFYGGLEVIGIYDGRVRVPLADASRLHPVIVNLLTHELAHALIDQATNGRAPKWIHEGIAQLVEMEEVRVNPMPDYKSAERLLSFPMTEAVLRTFPSRELTAAAYDTALWTLIYIETVHGLGAVHGLIEAFGRGLSEDEAIREVLNMEREELSQALFDWWSGGAPKLLKGDVVRYDLKLEADDGAPAELRTVAPLWRRMLGR